VNLESAVLISEEEKERDPPVPFNSTEPAVPPPQVTFPMLIQRALPPRVIELVADLLDLLGRKNLRNITLDLLIFAGGRDLSETRSTHCFVSYKSSRDQRFRLPLVPFQNVLFVLSTSRWLGGTLFKQTTISDYCGL
jgi:hypothetical protein